MSQSAEILAYMQSGKSITAADAMAWWGCFRLAARIKELRDKGHIIKTTIINNGRKQYARYSIEVK